jgi:hypothetical protein
VSTPTRTIADDQQAWKRLRPDTLPQLASTMNAAEIADAFGVTRDAVERRLAFHGLTACVGGSQPRRKLVHNRLIPCTAGTVLGANCGAPIEPDGTCRWAHQHTAQ